MEKGLQEQLRQLQKENAELKRKLQLQRQVMSSRREEVNGHRLHCEVSVSDAVPCITLGITGNKKDYSDVLVHRLIGDKVTVLVDSKTKDVHAGNLVKELA